jgi:hypothetical protein
MKKIFLLATLAFSAMTVSAQQVMTFNQKLGVVGGKEGKNYAMIVKTGEKKKDLVDKTTNFLARYMLVDKKDVKLDEIDENTAEYSVPFYMRMPIQNGKMMGMPIAVSPIKLIATLRFQFQDGGALVVVEDMSTHVLWVDPNGDKEKNTELAKYWGDNNAVLSSKLFITKALVFMNGGSVSDFVSQLDSYFDDVNKRWAVYDEMDKKGTGKWLSNQEYIEWEKTHSTFKQGSKNYEAEINGLQKFYDEHRMFLLSEDRWEKHARPVCDNLFRAIASGIDGKITGIAEDGNQTWDIVDGKLVPTDPKLQKKYLKKGLSYDNQEQ